MGATTGNPAQLAAAETNAEQYERIVKEISADSPCNYDCRAWTPEQLDWLLGKLDHA